MTTPQQRAFLDTIAASEIGPALLAASDNGYDVVVGSTLTAPNLFVGYADHPRERVWLESLATYSTAAGRYQVLERYFDIYKKLLALPDFSPASQDRIALQMIHECHAIDDIEAGRIADALAKCKSRWASFPSANYPGQHMNGVPYLVAAFQQAGGVIA